MLLLLLGTVRLLVGCAEMQKSAYYPSELRIAATQSEDDRNRRPLATSETVELRWPLKPAPVVDVSRPTPSPSPRYAEPPCFLPLPQ